MNIFDKKVQENIMKKVIKEVNKAIEEGNGPFAAFLVDYNGNILFKAHNKTRTKMDPTAHGEVLLIRKACKKLNTRDLSNYSIFTNAEPCSMCMSAIIKSNIKGVFYGADTEDHNNPYLRVEDVVKKCNYKINIINGILKDECQKQISDLRNK